MKFSLFLVVLGHILSAKGYVYINLATAGTYAALSFSAITNTGPTILTGDIGTTGTSITGFPPGIISGGRYISGQVTIARNDALAAYNTVANLGGAIILVGNLGGRTLGPGTYRYSTSAQMSGILTLAGTGSPTDAWYFLIGSTLVTSIGSTVRFTGGGRPCNVFWAIGTSATIDIGTTFIGTLLAQASISMNTRATSDGGLFALNGGLTLDTNNLLAEFCRPAVSSTSSTARSTGVFFAKHGNLYQDNYCFHKDFFYQ